MLFLNLAFREGFVFKVNKIFGIYLRLIGCMGIQVDSGPYFFITYVVMLLSDKITIALQKKITELGLCFKLELR